MHGNWRWCSMKSTSNHCCKWTVLRRNWSHLIVFGANLLKTELFYVFVSRIRKSLTTRITELRESVLPLFRSFSFNKSCVGLATWRKQQNICYMWLSIMVSRRTLRKLKYVYYVIGSICTCVIKIICWKSPRIQSKKG